MNNTTSNNNLVYNKENHFKAEARCREARKLVKQATELKTPDLMFKAIEFYTEAISIYPRLLEPYLSIAYISLQYNQKNNAIMLLNKALEMDPSNKKAKSLMEKAKNFKVKSKEILPISEKIETEQRIHKVQRISANEELKMVELRAVVREDNFNILKDLAPGKSNEKSSIEAPIEKIVSKEQLTKDKIDKLEKMRTNANQQVKIKVNMNSPFMQLFKK